jgi:hypothetical protein
MLVRLVAGNTIKLREHPKDLNTKRRRKRRRGRANSPGYGNSLRYEHASAKWAIRSQVLRPLGAMDAVHRPNGSGWLSQLLKIWSGPSGNIGDKSCNSNRSVGEPAEGSLKEAVPSGPTFQPLRTKLRCLGRFGGRRNR